MKRLGRFVCLSSVLLVAATSVTGCTIERDAPNLAGQDVSLTVLHTSDLHSRFYPYFFAPGQIDKGLGLVPPPGSTTALIGGIARIATVAKCIRGWDDGPQCDKIRDLVGPPAQRSIHLDSGDIWEGAPVFNFFSGEVETRAMSQIGLTAMALGNHEFDKGSVNLYTQLQRFAGFPMMAANYQFGDPTDPTQPKLGRIIQPYTMINVGGLRVGVIGMGNLSSIQGLIEGGNSLGARPMDEVQAITNAAEVLRPQVDLLTVVSHLGLDEDEGVAVADAESRDQNTAIALAGIDVIFGGHLHIVLNPPKNLPRFDSNSGQLLGNTVLCHSGAFAKYIGRLDLVVHIPTDAEAAAGQRATVRSYAYRVIPITADIPSDPDMEQLLDPYQLIINRQLNLSQVYALIPCMPSQQGNCPKVVRNAASGGDSQLGNLVAASMRFRPEASADFALTNSLGIRADFESGPLDLEQMYNVFPFENTIATMFLSGIEVQQMLDFVAARSSERGCRAQAQVSGIYFDMVCGNTDPECNNRLGYPSACSKNIYLGDGCRLPDGTMDASKCRPLDPFGEYRVAVNDYIANGGSGFAVLKRNTTKYNTGISLRNALVDYIRTLPDRCDPAMYDSVAGVYCRDATGQRYDCTARCCGHDADSGPVRCSEASPQFQACLQATPVISPELFDYTNVSCLVPNGPEASDGRINPITSVN